MTERLITVDVDLADFDNAGYTPGAGPLKRILWYITNAVVFDSWLLPVYPLKAAILRWFGATVGHGLVIKPRVNIKYPWRLRVSNNVWIGEGTWIDNLGDVEIGDNVCISQGALLLTGNHDYRDPRFRLIVKGIVLEHSAWVGAKSTVCPGVRMARSSMLVVGSTLRSNTEPAGVYSGNPAELVKRRVPRVTSAPD